jgi:propane monooxygenase small subunit
MQAAPRNGDFVTPTLVGAEEYDFAERDLRYTRAMFELLTNDREFADHNKAILQGWLSGLGAAAIPRPARCSRCGRSPTHKPPRFEDSPGHGPRTGSPAS